MRVTEKIQKSRTNTTVKYCQQLNMASSSINTCKMTGFEIHTTYIRNPHKSASFISIHLAKTEFLYSKLPRPLELKTFPWLGSCIKQLLAYVINLQNTRSHCVFAQNVPCQFAIASYFENNSCEQTVFPPTQKCQEVSAPLQAN